MQVEKAIKRAVALKEEIESRELDEDYARSILNDRIEAGRHKSLKNEAHAELVRLCREHGWVVRDILDERPDAFEALEEDPSVAAAVQDMQDMQSGKYYG